MKKILIITHQFPPMGGAGVQRTTKFVKYLPEFGFVPIVLTGKRNESGLRDKTLVHDLTSDLKVIKTKAHDWSELSGLLEYPGKFIAKRLFIPDQALIWFFTTIKTALDVINSQKISLIYSTCPPYSNHLLGLKLKQEFPDIKWVCDFRDEWTNNPFYKDAHFNPIKVNIEKKLEKQVLNDCDVIIANSDVMMRNFIENHPDTKEKITYINNGYDQADFSGLDNVYTRNSNFTITYTGSLYGRNNPTTLFEALSSLISQKKIDENFIEVNFFGNLKIQSLKKIAADLGLDRIINVHTYIPHRECLEHLAKSECVLLIIGDGPDSDVTFTGKLFEYMNIGRPILAIVPPDGGAANLIRESNTGVIADYGNVKDIENKIFLLYDQWLHGSIEYQPDREIISRYERKNLTRQLANILDQ